VSFFLVCPPPPPPPPLPFPLFPLSRTLRRVATLGEKGEGEGKEKFFICWAQDSAGAPVYPPFLFSFSLFSFLLCFFIFMVCFFSPLLVPWLSLCIFFNFHCLAQPSMPGGNVHGCVATSGAHGLVLWLVLRFCVYVSMVPLDGWRFPICRGLVLRKLQGRATEAHRIEFLHKCVLHYGLGSFLQ